MESTPTSANENSVFADETGSWSASRVFLAAWLVQVAAYVWTCLILGIAVANPVLAMFTAVATGLVAWAGGTRIAQYIGPQIGAATSAVGAALQTVVAKRRDPVDGIESTP